MKPAGRNDRVAFLERATTAQHAIHREARYITASHSVYKLRISVMGNLPLNWKP